MSYERVEEKEEIRSHIVHAGISFGSMDIELDCIDHDRESCNLQSWWDNSDWQDMLEGDWPLDCFPAYADAFWSENDEPSIMYNSSDLAEWVRVNSL